MRIDITTPTNRACTREMMRCNVEHGSFAPAETHLREPYFSTAILCTAGANLSALVVVDSVIVLALDLVDLVEGGGAYARLLDTAFEPAGFACLQVVFFGCLQLAAASPTPMAISVSWLLCMLASLLSS